MVDIQWQRTHVGLLVRFFLAPSEAHAEAISARLRLYIDNVGIGAGAPGVICP